MIKQFKGEFAFLSNFQLCRIELEGRIYPSAEHAYQAHKVAAPDDELWKALCETKYISAAEIKKKSRTVKLRSDWEEVKVQIMKDVLLCKFQQNATLKTLLLDTGKQEIQEGNTWNDVFWGVDLHTGYGENWLGKLLMQVRTELK